MRTKAFIVQRDVGNAGVWLMVLSENDDGAMTKGRGRLKAGGAVNRNPSMGSCGRRHHIIRGLGCKRSLHEGYVLLHLVVCSVNIGH